MAVTVTGPAAPSVDDPPLAARLEGDRRLVLTLDAGGTRFVFSALRGGREVVPALCLAAPAHDLAAALAAIVDGFERIRGQADGAPAAISFGFPGPADYPAGVVGNTHNLPAFRSGVALGPMLEDRFGVPVFITNDCGLFAYGEALRGFLPYVNQLLEQAGSARRYRNLFGATLGTGFGGGFVADGRLHGGDNGAAGEVWALRHKEEPQRCVEDGVSVRAVRGEYARQAAIDEAAAPDPRAIFEIAEGRRPGDVRAARSAFLLLGEITGDGLAGVVTLLDCPVVIGGGLSGAASLFLPALVAEMNGSFQCAGARVPRSAVTACNLEDPADRDRFLLDATSELEVPGRGGRVRYAPSKRLPVGLSRLGASQAAAIGAYAVALDALDTRVRSGSRLA